MVSVKLAEGQKQATSLFDLQLSSPRKVLMQDGTTVGQGAEVGEEAAAGEVETANVVD